MLSIVYSIKPKFTTSVYIVKVKQKWRREGGYFNEPTWGGRGNFKQTIILFGLNEHVNVHALRYKYPPVNSISYIDRCTHTTSSESLADFFIASWSKCEWIHEENGWSVWQSEYSGIITFYDYFNIQLFCNYVFELILNSSMNILSLNIYSLMYRIHLKWVN